MVGAGLPRRPWIWGLTLHGEFRSELVHAGFPVLPLQRGWTHPTIRDLVRHSPLGGNPVLIKAVQDALMNSKYPVGSVKR